MTSGSQSRVSELRQAASSLRRAIGRRPRLRLDRRSFPLALGASDIVRPDRDYEVLAELGKSSKTIFDVGANQGSTVIVFCQSNRDATVVAFEASASACRLIRDNCRLNSFENRVRIVNSVIADTSGEPRPFYGGNGSAGSSLIPGYLGHDDFIERSTLTIDDFVQHTGLAPDLVKIDVEGAENEVLRGMKGTLRTSQPLVVVELHSTGSGSVVPCARRMLQFLSQVHYVMIYIRTKAIVDSAEELEGRGRTHVLLIPREHPVPSGLLTLDTSSI